MLFSLLLYTDTVSLEEAGLVRPVHFVLWALATPVVIVLGVPFIGEAWRAARRGRLTAESLVALGALAAYGYSAVAAAGGWEGVYFDTAAMLLVLFTVGRYLEAVGRARAARTLAPALEAERGWAAVLTGDQEIRRHVTEVAVGDTVRVRPGERMPVDGDVIDGRSSVNEAILTGESRRVPKSPGSPVLAGSLNGEGQLLIRASAAGAATRWAGLSRFVREALMRRTRLQRMADRAAAVFVPFVLLLAFGTVVYWSQTGPFDRALLAGLAVLVVACPCALGLATPLATSLGIGRAARRGVLVRDGSAFETLARLRGIALDKTGTLTSGEPHVDSVEVEEGSVDELLRRAASVEIGSEHPLSGAIVSEARKRGLKPHRLAAIDARPGRGVIGRDDRGEIAAGSPELFAELSWHLPQALRRRGQETEVAGDTVIYVGWDGRLRGMLSVHDTLRPEAASVIREIRELGLATLLLSGDRPGTARRVA
ncbi:MAG: cation-translocating P-type ATPase, partial [Gemmatimonadetes bacterium]|nr:cation-translocating P-type ATPase [Gemmatimonadota bacterium]NIR73635.1 cation-translocating P-type ATPase [Candidatus Kutchimonas denitrificans]NIR99594.1 cation-translocating P-type ATPase [Gemmatimonadota bacterium]NIT65214.1 cation-translocating P-type ATPase [Gemmatimonadota bacterium]NIV23747.1 heavy metal translocating P-type ATPase [Gemmatimonadota bacterium]